ncbi:MAG TPA: hypothetical protein VG077_13035 [Verrucomicrobiae bacterium]|nr:hypothetical protein [Verrucomicrobiae bacterium]
MLPDIDIDILHDRKDDVMDLMFAKYGQAQYAVVRVFIEYLPWSSGGGWVSAEHTPSGGVSCANSSRPTDPDVARRLWQTPVDEMTKTIL